MDQYRVALRTLVISLCTLESGGALADGPYPRSTHEFALGATRQSAQSTVLASVPELPPVNIELKDLDLEDERSSWFAEYRWRFRERWLLDVFAYQYKDKGRVAASKDFNYNGQQFSAGAVVDSKLEVNTLAMDVLYAVHQGDRSEVLVGGGIHALQLTASFRAAIVGENEIGSLSRASDTLLYPVPNFRAQGTFDFNDRVGADLTAGWMSADMANYDGSFGYLHARLRCRLGDRSSLSLGYQFTAVDVSREPGNGRRQFFDGELQGPTVQFAWSF